MTPGPPPPPECTKNEDCPGFDDRCAPAVCAIDTCVEGPVTDCDDHDSCTIDSCDPATGACSHERSTLDLDGDGYYAPLPGHLAGDPGSCGNDCDDTNANAHPGGMEVCDGVDNDCNGIVDDNATLVLAPGSEVQVSVADEATAEGMVGYGGGYMAAYSGVVSSHASVYLAPLRDTGARVGAPIQFTTVAADAFGGPLTWLGDRFGLTWSDRRDARSNDNYEVYFNLVNPDATKRLPDLRITQSNGFSINPAIAWTGSEFIVLWQDDGLTSTGNTLFGQRLDVNGAPIGQNMRLANDGSDQTPAIAVGQRSVGIVWMRGESDSQHVMFAVFDQQLQPIKAAVEVTDPTLSGTSPTIVFNRGQYVIAWHNQESSAAPKTIFATVKGELGEDVVPTRALVRTTATARFASLLPYGDRILFVWSDERDGNLGYEIYANLFTPALVPIMSSDLRLTNAPGDSIQPIAAFGPNGDAGVLFTDQRSHTNQAYFTRLACVASSR